MKITIMTCLSAKGDMDVDACQFISIRTKLVQLIYSIGLVCFLLVSGQVVGQQKFEVYDEEGVLAFSRRISMDSTDQPGVEVYRQKISSDGYFLNRKYDTEAGYRIDLGPQFHFSYIDWEKFPNQIVAELGLLGSAKRMVSWSRFQKDIEQILKFAENSGYPFALLRVDSLFRQENIIQIRLAYDAGPLITVDTLNVSGIAKTKPHYLANYLNLTPGANFSESRYKKIAQRIDQLSFLELVTEPRVDFINEKAEIILDLEEQKVNAFDGIIGFLQNTNNQRLIVTGLVDLELFNLFGTGKELVLHWQQQKERSQSLELSYFHPMLFGSDVGASFGYDQLKEDTTFINRNLKLGFNFPLNTSLISTKYRRNTGRVLGQIDQVNSEALIADFNIDYYEIGLSLGQYNQAKPLEKGGALFVHGTIGRKAILRNQALAQDFYDSIQLKSNQYQWGIDGRYSLPVYKNWGIYQRMRASGLYNPNLFFNDLMRIGGLKTLRGFNELQYFTNQYILSNTEIRWSWDQRSYLFFFYDQAILETKTHSSAISQSPFGLGLGVSLTTKTGIFSLVYAIGESAGQSLNLNEAKVHFGFTSRF